MSVKVSCLVGEELGGNPVKGEVSRKFVDQAPVVQRPDNFIQRISHYPTVSICAKISVFRHAPPNMHTLTTF